MVIKNFKNFNENIAEKDKSYSNLSVTISFNGDKYIRLLNILKDHDYELYTELAEKIKDFEYIKSK